MGEGLDHGDDLRLARACAEGDPAALRRFDDEILRPAVAAVRSIDAAPAFVDEVTQRLRARLLAGDGTADGVPAIGQYAGRGALRAWIGVAAVRTALMMKRTTQRQREVSDDDWAGALSLATTGNPELELLKRQHATAFAAALRDAALALEPRLRAGLAMHFAEDLTIDEIGAAYAVHRATAARGIPRARELLFEQTRAHLIERLALSPTEVDRLTALVQSQVDVSLSQLLG